MSASLNEVILIGNLTGDPELKHTQSGTARTRFSVAVNRKWKDASGTLQEDVTFVPIVTWGAQAESCANYLAKGRSVAVVGRLRIDSFENAEGERKKVVEVVANVVQFLGSKPNGDAPQQSDAAEPAQGTGNPPQEESGEVREEVPF